jgi:hypothetical protein
MVGIAELLAKDPVTAELEDLLFEIKETQTRVHHAVNCPLAPGSPGSTQSGPTLH